MKNPFQRIDAFFSQPLLVEGAYLRMMLAALNEMAAIPVPQAAYRGGRSDSVVTIKSEIAVIPVLNLLTYRATGWSFLFDDTSYQDVRRNFRQAIGDPTVSAIVLNVASPGGASEGLFDLVDEIYQARGVKPIYAIVDESAYSAGYAIASAADKVFLPRTGALGSIGVRAVHIDQSAADEAAGMKYTEIYAGDRKIDGSSHQPLTEQAVAVFQGRVDQLYDLFIETVARNRGIKAADVRAQQAAVYYGKEAVAAGLADAVLSWDASWKKIIGSKQIKGGSTMKTKLQALLAEQPNEGVQALAELGYVPKPEQGAVVLSPAVVAAVAAALGIEAAQLAADPAKIDFTKLGAATVAPAVSAAKDEARQETIAYVQSIQELCALGGRPEMAAALIAKAAKVEDARAEILAAKAGESSGQGIRSGVGPLGTGAVNPLLADAKKRAGIKEA